MALNGAVSVSLIGVYWPQLVVEEWTFFNSAGKIVYVLSELPCYPANPAGLNDVVFGPSELNYFSTSKARRV